jgi:tRNA A37 threonylcarbamoyladenosine biosynthesis protein TsaE
MAALLTRLDGARLVKTAAFAELDDLGAFVVDHNEILVVDGDHGVGKTTLVDDWARRQSVPASTIVLPPKQSSRDIVRMAHTALTSGNEADELTERDIQDDLASLLAEPGILVIRNAHRLSAEAAGQLECLHTAARGHAFVFEGGPGTGAAVERDALLRGAVAATLTVKPLKAPELLPALQHLHLLFLGAETDLLVEIDTRVCRGVLAHWARFLQVALDLRQRALANGREEPVLDRRFAKAVLARMPSTITKKRA